MRPTWDPIGDAVANAVKDAWSQLAGKLYEGVVAALQWLSTWWLNIPAPQLMTDGGDSPAQKVMLYTRALVGVVGFISTVFVVVQYAMRKGNHKGEELGWAIGRVVVFSGLTLSVVMGLLAFGDQSAPWFVKTIGGETDFTKAMTGLSGNQKDVMAILDNSGLTLILIIVFLLALIGSLANLFFMLFTYAMLPIVAGMIPVLAAGSVTERGAAAFYKVIGWTLATCLFKPVAGIIYGGGIAMVRLLTSSEGSKLGSDQIALQTISGFMVIGAAGLVLPALVRLIVPTMAAASRGVGAGGLVMAGATLAAGAVMGGASLMAKLGGSRAQALAAGGRMGAPMMGGGPGNLGGPSPDPVNRGLVNPARHGYSNTPPPRPQPQGQHPAPPQAPPVKPSELGGPLSGSRPVGQGPGRPVAPRPAAPRPGTGAGRRRMGSAGDHLTQQLHRVEDAVEGGES
ncbi:hypothetical protein [Sinomonas humi]|uniref:Uncharacterized protein n=1 Tax=Sinomonas humi TaxID=1338436 RepID=A0A0B2AP76_9MICC|nr:hypothetical protein [Sinomonas humi]KHL03789.1 hypothetical protein LK10_08335 [Sinomonas humi]